MKARKILRIVKNIFYILATLSFLFIVWVICGFEAINFAPEYTGYLSEGNGPNSRAGMLVANVELFFPIMLYSFGKKVLLDPSKIMKGYGIFGILCVLGLDCWVIFVPRYLPWYEAAAFTFVVLDICMLLGLARYGICSLWRRYKKSKFCEKEKG